MRDHGPDVMCMFSDTTTVTVPFLRTSHGTTLPMSIGKVILYTAHMEIQCREGNIASVVFVFSRCFFSPHKSCLFF